MFSRVVKLRIFTTLMSLLHFCKPCPLRGVVFAHSLTMPALIGARNMPFSIPFSILLSLAQKGNSFCYWFSNRFSLWTSYNNAFYSVYDQTQLWGLKLTNLEYSIYISMSVTFHWKLLVCGFPLSQGKKNRSENMKAYSLIPVIHFLL